MSKIALCAFDAYGTLFDVAAAARRLADSIQAGDSSMASTGAAGRAFAAHWMEAADHWRRKQLEYTWLRASYGVHRDFREVTRDSLEWTLDALAIASGEERDALTERLMALYDALDAYPEAKAALEALAADGRRRCVISNGTPQMLSAAVGAAGFGKLIEESLSVETVGVFKPDRRVYQLVEQRMGVPPAATLFVSSNGWDICCAAAFGFRTAWVNRRGDPVDRLPGAPERIISNLSDLPQIARELEASGPSATS